MTTAEDATAPAPVPTGRPGDREPAPRDNNIGLLRLLFAAFVVLAHSPELIDGDRSRELLTRMFGTLSLGDVGVDGFFLLSGILITRSFADDPRPGAFLIRRAARIVPGYLVAFWICVLAVAPLAGASLPLPALARNASSSLMLLPPQATGAFATLPRPALNGAMWTIAYEARCYLAVVLIGTAGRALGLSWRRWRWALLGVVAAGLMASAAGVAWPAGLSNTVRFGLVFAVGSLMHAFRARLRLSRAAAALTGVALMAGLSNRSTAEVAFEVLGGLLILWAAFELPASRAAAVLRRTDISYGLYLYAWPIQNLAIMGDRGIDPWGLSLITLACAGAAGWASWRVVEAPALALGRRLARRHPSLA